MQIINSAGQVIKSFKQFSKPLEISVGDLKKGLYLMVVRFNGASFSQKFMKT